MFVITYRKIFFALSAISIGIALASIAIFGLHFGIDFTGGALTEVTYEQERPEKVELTAVLDNLTLGSYSLRETGDQGYILRTRDITEEEHVAVVSAFSLNGAYTAVEERFTSIGPTISTELRNKAFVAILVVVLAIIAFIAFVFRKVSQPVSSWKYGVIAIIALVHDIIIPTGAFALLGILVNAEVDALFIMALLAILGYSVNDTIVVFDRVRENLRLNREMSRKENFDITVGKSLEQTYTRSINTSLTTLFVLLALFFVGAPATQNFALVLLIGVIAGTYSSIFLATPLLVAVEKIGKKR